MVSEEEAKRSSDAIEEAFPGTKVRVAGEKEKDEMIVKKSRTSGIEDVILFTMMAGIVIIPLLSVIFLIAGAIKSSALLGIGIMGLGFSVYIISKTYKTVPHKQEWVIEIFGRYYITWKSGLHFLIPGVMTIRGKVTVDATKMVRIFMQGEDKLDFEDDSAEVTVEIRARATESKKPTNEAKKYSLQDVEQWVENNHLDGEVIGR